MQKKNQHEDLFQEVTTLNNKLNYAEQNLAKNRDEWKMEKTEFLQKVIHFVFYFASLIK